MVTPEELKKMDISKLLKELVEAKSELFKVKFEVKTGHEKATHKIKNLKKYIAQVSTMAKQSPAEKPKMKKEEITEAKQ